MSPELCCRAILPSDGPQRRCITPTLLIRRCLGDMLNVTKLSRTPKAIQPPPPHTHLLFLALFLIILISNRSCFPSPDCALVWPYVWHTNLLYMVYQKYQYNWIEIGAIKKPFKAHAKTDIPLLWDEIIWMSGQGESSSKKWWKVRCESKLEVRRRVMASDAQRLLFFQNN